MTELTKIHNEQVESTWLSLLRTTINSFKYLESTLKMAFLH